MTQAVSARIRSSDAPELPEFSASQDIAALKQTILEGNNGPEGRAAASALGRLLVELATGAPTVETRDLLRGLLDSRELDAFSDTDGVSCRTAVVTAQLALGFPYALEVTPEDLASARQDRDTGISIGLKVSAALSMVWNAAFTMLLALVASKEREVSLLLAAAAPFVIGAVHGGVALATAISAKPSDPLARRKATALRFRVLGMLGFLGPGLSLLVGVLGAGPLALIGMGLAAPAMVTAILCAVQAARVKV
jgi:hypothetical protein